MVELITKVTPTKPPKGHLPAIRNSGRKWPPPCHLSVLGSGLEDSSLWSPASRARATFDWQEPRNQDRLEWTLTATPSSHFSNSFFIVFLYKYNTNSLCIQCIILHIQKKNKTTFPQKHRHKYKI